MILGPSSSSTEFVALPRSARGLGDVNGDGISDFAISADTYLTSGGMVWVIFGKKTPAFENIDTIPANFGTNGVYFKSADVIHYFGCAVMPAGDFNNDGIADFLIGA